MVEYPKWVYNHKGVAIIVNNPEEYEALGDGWYDSPDPKTHKWASRLTRRIAKKSKKK